MKRLFLLLIFLLLLPIMANAQTKPPIHFTASVSPSPVRPGEIATVTVKAAVDPDWHVYSVVPTPGGPGTTEIKAANGWTAAGSTTEDTPISKVDPNFHLTVGYHENSATFSRQFRVPTDAKVLANEPLNVTIHYQTCNDRVCLPPTDAQVMGTVSLAAEPVRSQYTTAVPTPTLSAVSAPGASQSPGSASAAGSGSLALFLLAALGAGLLTLITPCVFPLIPITLTSFVKQADGDKGKLVRLSAGYALGIVVLFVAVGAIAAATLGAAGANKIAANPWANLIEGILFIVFALSFFEAITIQLPANLGALQSSARKHGGTAGLLLLGITFVLASFTCTAPFIGTLLVAATGGEKFRPLLGMLVFALAFVSPFFVFAAFPQWISKIPKSGVWLARAKATLGFIELAAALKYLSAADLVWQWKVLTQPVLLAAWAIIFFAAGLYLIGLLRFGLVAETETDAQRKQIPITRRAFAGAFTLVALYCFWGLAGRPLAPAVRAFLPPAGYGGAGQTQEASLPWLSDYNTALAEAKAENKPLLINFTGWTCTNCRYNESGVFPKGPVKQELANYVRLELYTDDAKVGTQNQKLQLAKFGDIALPLYGVINPQTGAVVDKTAGVQTVQGFTNFLTHAQMAVASVPTPTNTPTDGPTALWQPYTPTALALAAQQGKPVVVDFTADWCVNCKEIEHDVFEAPTVKPILGSQFVTLRVDMTKWGAPENTALQKQYGFGSLPTIVILDKSGKEIKSARITGRLGIPDFLKRLDQAAPSAGSGPGTIASTISSGVQKHA